MTGFERYSLRVSSVALGLFVGSAALNRLLDVLGGGWDGAWVLLCYASLLYTSWLMWKAGGILPRN